MDKLLVENERLKKELADLRASSFHSQLLNLRRKIEQAAELLDKIALESKDCFRN